MATTPPPPSTSIRTPPTPRHGGRHDNYDPFPPRKSTRHASQRNRQSTHSTPPPPSTLDDGHSQSLTPQTTTRSTLAVHTADTLSPPPTVRPSPKKKLGQSSTAGGSRRRVSGRLNDDNTASAAAALGISPTGSDSIPTISTTDMDASIATAAGTLPTPAKTPRKRPAQTAPGVKSTARILFPSRPETVEEVMPSPQKKRAKKYKGLSLDSFMGEDNESEKITIFTDSKDRVPELDTSEENPFYEKPRTAPAITTKGEGQVRRVSKRRRISRNSDVDDALTRAEGMVYVFRGKKVYRKFEADPDDEDLPPPVGMASNEAELDLPDSSYRPLTRSSIKPRLLFPTAAQTASRTNPPDHGHTDEEATTDIDDAAQHPLPSSDLDSDHSGTPQTPEVEAVHPFSPPATVAKKRGTRSKAEIIPVAERKKENLKREKKTSPFAGWQRTKAQSHAHSDDSASTEGKGKKRAGGELQSEGMSKRTRSGEYKLQQ